jgi:hypothetical protein
LPAPALAELIALAGAPERQSGGIAAALAKHYGVARQSGQSDWPLAPIRVAALGVAPGDAYWLAADPVTVELGLANAELSGIVDDLGRAEADALLATLNAHFASDGLAFVAPRPDRFFVRAAAAQRLSTVTTSAALRRPLRPLLPQGPDAGVWRRWHSEIEMLFHEHAVNVERERTGRAQVNSLWFSEGGTLPPPPPAARIATFATNDIASALAAFAGSPSASTGGRLSHGDSRCGAGGFDRHRACTRPRPHFHRARLGSPGARCAGRRLVELREAVGRRRRRRGRLARAPARRVATDHRPLSGARSARAGRRREAG